jgi:enoyl-[acyl-carrier protein] reductase III
MIEIEPMAKDTGKGCDGRCEIRLLEKLQKAISDILSEHTRGIAGSAGSRIDAPVRSDAPRLTPASQHDTRAMNGYSLPTGAGAAGPLAQFADDAGATAGVGPSRAEVATIVVDTIADITRYPPEILTDEARFDDDLGVDSLKRAEIVTALLNRLGGTSPELKTLGPMPLTIGEMTDFAVIYITKWGAPPQPRPSPSANTDDTDTLEAPGSPGPSADAGLKPSTPSQDVPQLRRPSSVWSGKMAPDRRLEGTVALVTGSGEGLGKIIAEQMAELGAHVIVDSAHFNEREEKPGPEGLSGNARAIHRWGSFASAERIERAFREIEERFGRLDYYVHNAADEVITSLDNATERHWEEAFRTNIVGYHLCAMRAAKLMQKSGGGRIVALSSPGAKRYMENYGVMGPVKAALESLTMYLARELGPYNVQVNAVSACAGQLNPLSGGKTVNSSAETPDEISEAVLFLLSAAAGKINGATMVIDGGWWHGG